MIKNHHNYTNQMTMHGIAARQQAVSMALD